MEVYDQAIEPIPLLKQWNHKDRHSITGQCFDNSKEMEVDSVFYFI
jgi:hypothetical protein